MEQKSATMTTWKPSTRQRRTKRGEKRMRSRNKHRILYLCHENTCIWIVELFGERLGRQPRRRRWHYNVVIVVRRFYYYYFSCFSAARLRATKMKRNRNIEDDPNFTFNGVFFSLFTIHTRFQTIIRKCTLFVAAHTCSRAVWRRTNKKMGANETAERVSKRSQPIVFALAVSAAIVFRPSDCSYGGDEKLIQLTQRKFASLINEKTQKMNCAIIFFQLNLWSLHFTLTFKSW